VARQLDGRWVESDPLKGAKMGKQTGFAIIRVDEFLEPSAPTDVRITVKRVVWTKEAADAEVSRLNTINSAKGCRYFWQATDVDRPPA
jgi:hypothetical protein